MYKKGSEADVLATNLEAANIANNLEIADRVDTFTGAEAFVTIKDHKENFPSKLQCRLINPAKTNIGKISKQIISKHLIKIREYTGSNQWTNTDGVLKWFSALKNKRDLTFLKFDIVSFYPSISEKLFAETVNWTNRISALTTEELAIVKHSRKSFLFSKGEPWLKKTSKNFDVTMGAYDGAEVCELVGLYILNKLESLINQEYVGLYRDDGLAVLDLPGPQIEQLRKNMFKLFKSLDCRLL